MRKWMLTLLVLWVVAGCRRPSSAHRAPVTPLATGVAAFEHVNVLRMDRDTVLADQTVIVRDARIETVGPAHSTRVPAGARRINGRSRFLMPALADMHVQLSPSFWRVRREMTLYVSYGVAMVRNLDGRSAHLRWRERVRRGEVLGPRILTCGPPIGSDT